MSSVNIESLVDSICDLNLIEAAQLTKKLEEKLGLPIGSFVLAGGGAGVKQESSEPVSEQTEFSVCLDGFEAADKIKVIKVIREITALGLKEAKDFVEKAGLQGSQECKKCKKEEAEELKKKLEEAGAKVSIK